MDLTLISPIAGISAILFAGYLTFRVLKHETGTPRMNDISRMIREGATVYLHRQHKTTAVIMVVLAVALALIIGLLVSPILGFITSVAFVTGAVLSALSGYIGMSITVQANVRTAQAARTGLGKALVVAFRGGAVTGMSVVGLSLLGIYFFHLVIGDFSQLMYALLGFGVGASLDGLFARVGGGIYTKAADVGADLVGKIEAGIPEDDLRNPGVIADLVGDNVGDVAGMGADLFESCTGSIIAAMILGGLLHGPKAMVFPLTLMAAGIFSTILGALLVRVSEGLKPGSVINRGIFTAGILAVIATYFLAQEIFGRLDEFYAMLAGVAAAILIGLITQYYTSPDRTPVRDLAEASQAGPANTLMAGLALGMRSTALPIIAICGAIFLAYEFAGAYGVAIAAMGMQSITGMIVAIDAYGPIVDNAGGIVEMVGLGPEVRRVTDELDSVGNTTKAICKGFAIGDAFFETVTMFIVYMMATHLGDLNLTSPYVLAGALIGGTLAFVFSALCLQAVGKTAFQMIGEIRRQFKEIPGLREWKAEPDYARCVDISTHAALKGLLAPAILSIAAPLVVGFTLGPVAVAGLFVGNIVCAFLLAVMMAYAGTAWDNAKKFIEAGHLGGIGTPTQHASVVGDAVGDPFKDTAGPSLDVMMSILSTVAVLFAGLFTTYALLG